MKCCISSQKVGVFFPHLMTSLCKIAEVLMEENEQFMRPTRSLIGDSMYTQYVELNQKQFINWNQRRKEKMDVLASLKRKGKMIPRREA
ncbi:hypothetical protein Gorai_022960, partial [Gossypium raimondii]|nr:hypothetical protein [Gossypium raimondii]